MVSSLFILRVISHLCPEIHATTNLGEIVKIANKAMQSLVGDFDNFTNFTSNQQVNANDKTRGPPLQLANMANLTNVTNSLTLADERGTCARGI